MKQELPNLVDERRFRRRETEQVERDELGRVSNSVLNETVITDGLISVNGRRRRSPLISNLSLALISVLRLLAIKVYMSSTFNKNPDAVSRSRAVAPDSWSWQLGVRATKTCICTLRKCSYSVERYHITL